MFETMVQFVLSEHLQGTTFDPPTSPPGYPRTLSRSRKPYATKDGFLAVLPYNDGQWRRFFEAIGKGHLLTQDSRFADITSRTANIDALYDMIGEELKARTTGEWLELLQGADIPCMVPHTLDSVLDDPHLKDRGFFVFQDHPSEGRIRTMAEAILRDAWMPEAQLQDADFTQASLAGSRLIGASLRQTQLRGADLRNADLSDTDLTETDFSGANLAGAKL